MDKTWTEELVNTLPAEVVGDEGNFRNEILDVYKKHHKRGIFLAFTENEPPMIDLCSIPCSMPEEDIIAHLRYIVNLMEWRTDLKDRSRWTW